MRLAVKAKALGWQLLDEIETLVTPDTLLAWHCKLIAQKWIYARKGAGRPRVAQAITGLVLRMAGENASWGYDRMQGALTIVPGLFLLVTASVCTQDQARNNYVPTTIC